MSAHELFHVTNSGYYQLIVYNLISNHVIEKLCVYCDENINTVLFDLGYDF